MVDIWNTPTLVTKKDGTAQFATCAEIWKTPPGVVHTDPEQGRAENTSVAELYREVKTPQTPECKHQWVDGFSMNGPTKSCTVCGKFIRD